MVILLAAQTNLYSSAAWGKSHQHGPSLIHQTPPYWVCPAANAWGHLHHSRTKQEISRWRSGSVPSFQSSSIDAGSTATRSNSLAETCCDLLSICSTMDLLLSPGSLCRSTTIGARVAPFSPVGCATHQHHPNPNPVKKTQHDKGRGTKGE